MTLVVSRRTRVTEAEAAYLAKLHETPPDEIDAKKTRATLWAPALVALNGLVMPWVLMRWYVHPYQAATGTLAADGSIDWFTGESLFVLSWSAVYLLLAVYAAVAIRRSYAPGTG